MHGQNSKETTDLKNNSSICPNTTMHRKLKEVWKLANRIERYEDRLFLEGFKLAGEYGLFVITPQVDDDCVDVRAFVELARNKYPSLYRRLFLAREKLAKRIDELKQMMNNNEE